MQPICQIKGLTIPKSPHLSFEAIISGSLCMHKYCALFFFLREPPIVPDATSLRGIQGELFLCRLHPEDRSIHLCLFCNLLTVSIFSELLLLYVVSLCKAVLCSSALDAFMQRFVCIYLSELQANHFMLSESLTILDIAWPLFQAVRSLVLSSYVSTEIAPLEKLIEVPLEKEDTFTHFQNSFCSNISIVERLTYLMTGFRIWLWMLQNLLIFDTLCLLVSIICFPIFSPFSSALAFGAVVIESE